jgi:hypothetical protein
VVSVTISTLISFFRLSMRGRNVLGLKTSIGETYSMQQKAKGSSGLLK